MKVFRLPDLGEGLHDAQIIEWKVGPGDEVVKDQVVVLVETAKATVDIPSPYAGRVHTLYGAAGDCVEVGKPLISFEVDVLEESRSESHSIVGVMGEEGKVLKEEQSQFVQETHEHRVPRIVPAARALAQQLSLDISKITATGPHNTITVHDVKQYSQSGGQKRGLSSAARSMMLNMEKIRETVVPVTVMDDADLHAWSSQNNLMLRVIRAIIRAKEIEPSVNVHYDPETLSIHSYQEIHLGIAVDSAHGLYVPVIQNVAQLSPQELRARIDDFKCKGREHSFTLQDLTRPTLILSNYGSIMGRYATPLVVPPTVLMIGVGRMREEPRAYKGRVEVHRVLPLSVSLDHRILTGGEAARFLKALVCDLELES